MGAAPYHRRRGMAEHRPYPPSPRRRALAHRAGLHGASPILAAAAAGAAALVVLGTVARALADRLGAALVAACSGAVSAPGPHAPSPPATLAPGAPALPDALGPGAPALPDALGPGAPALPDALLDVVSVVAGAVLPLAGAAALAAFAVHITQTRGLWIPRRRIAGAPSLESGPGARTGSAVLELAAAAAIGVTVFAWLWLSAPHIAALVELDPVSARLPAPLATPGSEPASAATVAAELAAAAPGAGFAPAARLLAGAAALLMSLGGALVAAWLLCGLLDALGRRAALARALAMTPAEHREDARLAGADPRWRARRAAVLRAQDPAEGVAGAALLVLGDGAAVAIGWDPARRPIPARTVTGAGPAATQLLGLARRYRIPVHRDPALAAALVHGDGPVPEAHWPRVAEIIAAVRGRDRASDG
jgi:type III secretion system FlhB-like substrate exporter